MDPHHPGRESTTEFRLSRQSARAVAGSTPPPRPHQRFLSTDHLSTEAAAAYVDGRLPAAGQVRADAHLARCPHCRREVADQGDARHALRGSGPIHMPGDLRERLRHLGDAAPGVGPAPESGLAPRSTPTNPWTRLVRRLRGLGR